MLVKAEGIFHQIKDAEHLTDNIRSILGLPIPVTQPPEPAVDDEVLLGSSPEEDPYERLDNTMQHIIARLE